jgi:hypothetical protein
MWSAYAAVEDGPLRISTEGSTFDTVLAVFTWHGNDTDPLVPVPNGCNNDSGRNRTSIVTIMASFPTIYYIVVDGVNGATGTVRLEVGPPLTLGQPRILPNNLVEVSLPGRAGQTYFILGSPNYAAPSTAWPVLFSNTVPTNVMRFTNHFRTNYLVPPRRLLFLGKEQP